MFKINIMLCKVFKMLLLVIIFISRVYMDVPSDLCVFSLLSPFEIIVKQLNKNNYCLDGEATLHLRFLETIVGSAIVGVCPRRMGL